VKDLEGTYLSLGHRFSGFLEFFVFISVLGGFEERTRSVFSKLHGI